MPNDALYEPADGLGQWGLRQIRAEQAWDRSKGDLITIAIVDSGIDKDHEDFSRRLKAGKTFFGCPAGCGDGSWLDGGGTPSPHGTHVAGIAGAKTDNKKGVAGVAPEAKLMPVKVIDEESGDLTEVANGIRWAVDHGADVVNLSLSVLIAGVVPGGQILTLLGDETEVDQAIAYARSQGVVVVAAAGNEAFPLCDDPAFASGALCVVATDSNELRPVTSNFAVNEGQQVVAAPGGGEVDFFSQCGGGVLSTVPEGTGNPDIAEQCGYPDNLAYDEMIGTSMAAPHVSGVAALLLAMGCDADQTVSLLKDTARNPLTGSRGSYTPLYGYGIVDADAATAAATDACAS